MSLPRIIKIPETVKDFFARKNLTDANHLYLGVIQGNFHLQSFRSRKSSISPKYSKDSSHAKLSRTKIINTPEIVKDFFARKYLSATNHLHLGDIQESFHLQNCLNRKSSISRKISQTFSPGNLSKPQIIKIPEEFKDPFARKMSLPQLIHRPEIVKDFLAWKNLTAANHLYLGVIQGNFHLQSLRSRKSSISPKYSKLSSPSKLSRTQIINTPEIVKDFFARKYLSALNHLYLGVIQESFHLQNCLNCKSSISRKNSQTFSPGNLSKPQIIKIPEEFNDPFVRKMSLPQLIDRPEIVKDFLAWKNLSATNHLYLGVFQESFHLQNCLNPKSSESRKYSQTFSLGNLSKPQIIKTPDKFNDFFAWKNGFASNYR